MSREENAEVVRRVWEAAFRRPEPDFETLDSLSPDNELVSPISRLEGRGSFRGKQGWLDWLATMAEAFASWAIRLEEMSAIDDEHVLVVATMDVRSRAAGVPAQQRYWYSVTVRDCKVIRTEACSSREEALAAVDQRE